MKLKKYDNITSGRQGTGDWELGVYKVGGSSSSSSPPFLCNHNIKDGSGTAVSLQPQHQGPIWHHCFFATPTSRIDLAPLYLGNPNIKDRSGTIVSLQSQHQ